MTPSFTSAIRGERWGQFCSKSCKGKSDVSKGLGFGKTFLRFRFRFPLKEFEDLLHEYGRSSRITSVEAFVEYKKLSLHPQTLRIFWQKNFPNEYYGYLEVKGSRNTPYRRGRWFEWRVRDYFKDKGYYVLRSPQSRGPADLVAIEKGEVLLIQCKIWGYMSLRQKEELVRLANSIGAIPLLISRGLPPKYEIKILSLEPLKDIRR